MIWFILAVIVIFFLYWLAFKHTKPGWEDSTGFHPGIKH